MPDVTEQQAEQLPLKRAESAAGFVLVVTGVAGLVALLLARGYRSASAEAEAWHLLVGALVWVVALMHQRLRRLADEEAREVGSLRARREREAGTSLFEEERQLDLFMARNRLEQFEKYFLPAFSIVILLALGGLSAWLLRRLATTAEPPPVRQPLMTAVVFIVGIAFVSFLLGRYTGGLATRKPWRGIRPGASYSMSCALGSFLVGVGLVCYHYELPVVERVMAYVVSGLLGVIALELLLSLVLSVYRPRLAAQEPRPAYDSRLLGMLTTSRGLLRTTAETLDYQFGFRVSETWFYRFLERAIAPLILFQMATLYLLTCFVIVDTGEQAVIERWGRPLKGREALGPGLKLKWPWPIDIARRYPVKRVEMLMVGEQIKEDVEAYLWTISHAEKPYNLLVANRETEQHTPKGPEGDTRPAPPEGKGAEPEDVVPVSMLAGTVYVYYAVRDLYDFLYSYADPKATLSAVSHGELVRYAASSDFLELLGRGRGEAATHLKKRIQGRADEIGLGVDIVGVSLQGVHPPIEVGESFEDVVGAMEDKAASVLEAKGYRNDTVPAAEAAAHRRETEADAYKRRRTAVAPAQAARFLDQLGVFRISPRVFRHRELLSMMEEALADRRKIIKPAWADAHEVTVIDLKDVLLPGMFGPELEPTPPSGGANP